MEDTDDCCTTYCPWLDESTTSMRTIDSHRDPQQRVIPRKVKKLIDGDLAAKVENENTARDRLKKKLRQKRLYEGHYSAQHSPIVISYPTDSCQHSGKQKKRRKKYMSSLPEHDIVAVDVLHELSQVVADQNKDVKGALEESAKEFQMVQYFRKGTPVQPHSVIVASLRQKLRQNSGMGYNMADREKHLQQIKLEVDILKAEKGLLPLVTVQRLRFVCGVSRSAAEIQKLKAYRSMMCIPKVMKPCLDDGLMVANDSRFVFTSDNNVNAQMSAIILMLSYILKKAMANPPGRVMRAHLSKFNRLIAAVTEYKASNQDISKTKSIGFFPELDIPLESFKLDATLETHTPHLKYKQREKRVLETSLTKQTYGHTVGNCFKPLSKENATKNRKPKLKAEIVPCFSAAQLFNTEQFQSNSGKNRTEEITNRTNRKKTTKGQPFCYEERTSPVLVGYDPELHWRMVKSVKFEREVKRQIRKGQQNTQRRFRPMHKPVDYSLEFPKLEKIGQDTEEVTAHRNEVTEVTRIFEDLKQTHYIIRMCIFD